jgi:hypothetical protein
VIPEPAPLLDAAALAVTGAGLVAAAVVLVATRRPLPALTVLLDLLLAAGLLRLTGSPGWPALLTAASVVLLRRLVGSGLRAGAPAAAPPLIRDR